MPLPLPFKEIDVGNKFVVEKEDYPGQIRRAAHNANKRLQKLFITRRKNGVIYVIRLD